MSTQDQVDADRVEVGTFIKSDTPHVVEILGTTGLDFGVVDAEHAPFGRASIDLMMLAGRAVRFPLFVRLPDKSAATILNALDTGAAGLLVPHVDTPEDARQIVRHARFRGGERGFSPSGRWADYGTMPFVELFKAGDAARIVCQIESPEALANCDAIAAVPGVDALFVGRGDLSVSMGLRANDPKVTEATMAVIASARAAGKRAGLFIQGAAEIPTFAKAGATWFVAGSDQALLRRAAVTLAEAAHGGGPAS